MYNWNGMHHNNVQDGVLVTGCCYQGTRDIKLATIYAYIWLTSILKPGLGSEEDFILISRTFISYPLKFQEEVKEKKFDRCNRQSMCDIFPRI